MSNISDGDQRTPLEIAQDKGYIQTSSSDALLPLVKQYIAENPDKVELIRAGKDGLIGFFVGEIRKRSGAKADPLVLRKLILEELGIKEMVKSKKEKSENVGNGDGKKKSKKVD